MKLADLLRLELGLPADPLEAAIATRHRRARVAEQVTKVMSNIYEDWNECIDVLDMHARQTGADSSGDA